MKTGSCHCGAVRFEVDNELDGPVACNCSMCGRAGTLLVFVPEEQFRLLSGAEQLQDYQFGKQHIHHTFCRVCGIKPFASGVDPKSGGLVYAVNVRCVDGVDVQAIAPHWYDGAAL